MRLTSLTSLVFATSLLGATAGLHAAWIDFGGWNLVVMRGGDATHSQSTFGGGEVPAYLDIYSVSVTGGVATPTLLRSGAVDPAVLTLPGATANSHEGRL